MKKVVKKTVKVVKPKYTISMIDAANVSDVTDALALKADITYTEYLMMEGDPA